MRIFVAFEDVRLPLDVQPGQTFGDIKTVIKDHFKLSSSQVEGKILQLTYAGAVLHDEWVCADCGINSGSTIKSALKDSDQPVLHIDCTYNNEIVPIREQIHFATATVSELKGLVSAKLGLPVTVFRLCTKEGREIYDCHKLETYNIVFGQTLKLYVWDGWSEILTAATQGHTRKVFRSAAHDEQVAKFQFRAACFIAAHFGFLDLANSLINPKLGGVKPEEPVGQHPARLWSKNSTHIEAWSCPVHEAARRGKLNVLRIFVQSNICCLVAKDGEGRTPIQVSFRNDQLECVQYLTSKLYSSHTDNAVTLPVTILIRAKKWCEKARENVLINQGAYKSSMRRRPYRAPALIGHGVFVDGFGESRMMSRPKANDAQQFVSEMAPLPGIKTTRGKSQMKRQKMVSESSIFSNSDHKLPGIGRQRGFMSRGTEETTPTDEYNLNTDSGSFIQTPKPFDKPKVLPAISEGEKRGTDSETSKSKDGPVIPLWPIQAKTGQSKKQKRGHKMMIEGTIPLPAMSAENTLRPFFHASSKTKNPVYLTLKLFEKYREIGSRENAIQCMTVASTFKDKAWLRQVDLAISLAKRGVFNCLEDTSNDVTRSLPTVAASPIKVRD